MDAPCRVDESTDVVGGGDLCDIADPVPLVGTLEDLELRALVRVADGGLHQEAVQLCLGKGVGAIHLDGVLRRDDDERVGDEMGVPVDRDLMLLHHLEKGRLGAGSSPVDLVGEDDVGEYRSWVEYELVGVLVEDRDPGDVPWEEVGRELDTGPVDAEGTGQGAGQGGLSDARHILEQEVALGEQAGDGHTDDVRLAADESVHGCLNGIKGWAVGFVVPGHGGTLSAADGGLDERHPAFDLQPLTVAGGPVRWPSDRLRLQGRLARLQLQLIDRPATCSRFASDATISTIACSCQLDVSYCALLQLLRRPSKDVRIPRRPNACSPKSRAGEGHPPPPEIWQCRRWLHCACILRAVQGVQSDG